MVSLREYVGEAGKKYLWGVEQSQPVSKVNKISSSNKYSTQEMMKGRDVILLRKIVESEPLIKKAIYKKNRDTFKNWFVIKNSDDEVIPEKDLKFITDFDKKTNFKTLLYMSGVCANIYGTGFIEKIYNEHGNTKPSSSIDDRKNLIGLELLNSENIKERKKLNDKGKTLYPVYKAPNSSESILIHPTRLEVVRIDYLPYSYFGTAIPKVVWNILKSKMMADVSSGEILNWFGRGMFDVEITGMTDDDEKEAHAQLKSHPDYLLHDENFKVDVKNPTRVDPAPFYDYFYTNIAAALDMPKHMLVGSEIGNVTGSEVGTSAYYSDIQNIQSLVFTPIVENIYSELFRSLGKVWDYTIEWNPILVDELSEAKILQTRAYSASQAVGSGIVSKSEGRIMLNKGLQNLDPDDVPEDEEPEEPEVTDPNIEPQPAVKPESNFRPYLTRAEKEMIMKNRLKGQIELELQEQRLKEAVKK